MRKILLNFGSQIDKNGGLSVPYQPTLDNNFVRTQTAKQSRPDPDGKLIKLKPARLGEQTQKLLWPVGSWDNNRCNNLSKISCSLKAFLSVTLTGDLQPFALIFKSQMGGFGTFFINMSHCTEFESFSDKTEDPN